MQKIETFQQAGPDKLLHLAIPVEQANQRYQVTVLVKQVQDASGDQQGGLAWPPGFFEQTAGSIDDETFYRHDQGQYEHRLPLE